MFEALRIEYLADCPAVLPQLEEWFLREWAPYYGPDGPWAVQRYDTCR